MHGTVFAMQPVGWLPSWLQRAARKFLVPQQNRSVQSGLCSTTLLHLGNLHEELRRSQSMNPDGHLNTEAATEAPFPQRWHCQHLLPAQSPLSCRLCQPTHPIPQTPWHPSTVPMDPELIWAPYLTQPKQPAGCMSVPRADPTVGPCLLT